jgi:hypothetical protein
VRTLQQQQQEEVQCSPPPRNNHSPDNLQLLQSQAVRVQLQTAATAIQSCLHATTQDPSPAVFNRQLGRVQNRHDLSTQQLCQVQWWHGSKRAPGHATSVCPHMNPQG